MLCTAIVLALTLLPAVYAQQIGTNTAEVHPSLTVATCTKAGGCSLHQQSVVLDSNWRWLHNVGGVSNCFVGNTWNATLCPDPLTCAENCALDGADYPSTGITTSGNALRLEFVTGSSVGSRVFLLANNTEYQVLSLINQEFAFDVDVSQLPCGVASALHLSQMFPDGGLSEFPTNHAGAQYGTGYCSAQCPHDIKFINGQANLLGWQATSSTSGTGKYGACCPEMDIWQANSEAAVFAPHPCTVTGPYRCSGVDCGDGAERYDGVCDKDGCDFNSWRLNDTFLGPGLTVDTTRTFTVVTQFISDDGTATGNLAAIKRYYVQNGVFIPNSYTHVIGIDPVNDITDEFCVQEKVAFGDENMFEVVGGLTEIGASIKAGMVLALSIWDDSSTNLLWLDGIYPVGSDPTVPGNIRGPCPDSSVSPVEITSPSAFVTFSNIKWGEINSTSITIPVGGSSSSSSHSSTSSSSSSSSTSSKSKSKQGSSSSSTSSKSSLTTSSPSSVPTGVAQHYGQCGGIGWTGPTICVSPYTCTVSNAYYSECL